jgi:Fe-Mn family superoxide dismutase
MSELNRREMLGTLGTLAAASGWISLNAGDALAQEKKADKPATPAAPAAGADAKLKEYVLPPLPYPPDALEPHIDAQTMTLHHDKHHAAYVKGLNDALAKIAAARQSGQGMENLRAWTDAVAFNGSGHMLHSIFWTNMKKGGGGEPKGPTAKQIEADFGGFDKFKAQFGDASKTVQGSGWGILAWEPLGSRLIVLGAEKHDNLTVFGCMPLLVLDVWEHAYYLKYQNKRADYVDAWWNVVNWENVDTRLAAAIKL